MFNNNQINYIFRLWLDTVLLAICFVLAYLLVNYSLNGLMDSSVLLLFFLSALCWYIGARVFLLYGEITLFSFSQEMTIFLRQLVTHLLVLISIIFFFYQEFQQYRTFLLLYHALLLVIVPIEKYFYRVVVAYIRKQYRYEKNVLLVGAGPAITNFFRTGIFNNNLQYNLVGILDDEEQTAFNGKYLGPVNRLLEVLDHKREINEVFLALPSNEVQQIDYVIDVCEKKAMRVSVIQDFGLMGAGSLRVTNYAGLPVVGIRYFPLDEAENRFFKRLFDLVFSSLVLLLVYSWLWPLVAIAIKLDSRGPVLFKQERWGLNNKKIICYKFRTMYLNHDKGGGDQNFKQASRLDPRVTRVGRLLRKTSLDELPQFVNVLLGNMSVVGPRPHPIPLSLESKDVIQNYMLRHLVKPGITGWAQVNGSRGETRHTDDMRKRVNFDLWYIENWSLWLDVQIIFQTIVNMLKGDENAY